MECIPEAYRILAIRVKQKGKKIEDYNRKKDDFRPEFTPFGRNKHRLSQIFSDRISTVLDKFKLSHIHTTGLQIRGLGACGWCNITTAYKYNPLPFFIIIKKVIQLYIALSFKVDGIFQRF